MPGSDRQTPRGGEIYLDHVGWFIQDVAEASTAFEHLGFVLTPFVVSRNADASGVLKPSGTGNRCAMLHRGYLELIAAIEGMDTPLARQHRAAAAHHVGVHVIAFTVADASAAHARLAAEGFEPLEPVRLRRPIRTREGDEAFAEFTVVRVPPEKMPEGRVQILTQETPDLIWQSRLISRENSVTSLSGVLFCVDEPKKVADRYGRFVGRVPHGGEDYYHLALDRGRLGFASPSHCRSLIGGRLLDPSCVAAVSFSTDNVPAARAFFVDRAVSVSDNGAPIFFIGADEAAGTALVVHRSSDPWPPTANS